MKFLFKTYAGLYINEQGTDVIPTHEKNAKIVDEIIDILEPGESYTLKLKDIKISFKVPNTGMRTKSLLTKITNKAKRDHSILLDTFVVGIEVSNKNVKLVVN